MNYYQNQNTKRGSVMLMVVVMLVLMAIIGMAYLQLARLDRMASNVKSADNIEIVAAATLAYIGDVLKNDIINGNKDAIFDLAENIDELYDYPSTSTSATFPVLDQDGNAMSEDASGGRLDDTWLASTEPDFSGSAPIWPHITNLNGIFLRLPDTSGTIGYPEEEPVNNSPATPASQQWRFDTDVPFKDAASPTLSASETHYLSYKKPGYSSIGADADGDGILDSKWTWAPIRQLSGVSYVMAVRIIDNSSLVNPNVALSLIDGSNTRDTDGVAPDDDPRWNSPSELDFGRFFDDHDTSGNYNELVKMLEYRLNAALPTSPAGYKPMVPYTGTPSREIFWLNGPSMFSNFNGDATYTTSYNNYSSAEEINLRYRNGLNNPTLNTRLGSSSNGLYNFMRSSVSESSYSPTFTSMQSFFTNDPRHKMSVYTGNSIYIPSTVFTKLDDFSVKVAVNELLDNPPALSDRLWEVFGSIPSNQLATFPHPYDSTTINDMCNQAAVNIIDYADADNQLTPFDSSQMDTTLFGMEALPALSEVYVQRAYKIDSATNRFPPLPAPQVPIDPNKWDLVTSADSSKEVGYAIEIRNPFQMAVSLKDVYLYVNGVKFSNGDVKGDLAAVTGKNELNVGQLVVLYHNSSGGNPSQDTITNLIDPSEIISISDSWPTASGSVRQDCVVELRATIADGSDADSDPDELDWGYQKFDQIVMPASETLQWYEFNNVGDPTGNYIYTQKSVIGSGDGINTILMSNSTDTTIYTNLNTDTTAEFYRLGITALGKTDKSTVSGPASYINTTNLYDKVYFSDLGDIYYVGELFLVNIVGPNKNNDYAKQWDKQTNIANSRIPYKEPAPHGYHPIDRFTIYSPKEDGRDNDGDGENDNSFELLIPGTINLNTATKSILQSILPIEPVTDRDNLIDEIIDYRDMKGLYNTGITRATNYKGIRSLHELYFMTQGTNGGTSLYGFGSTSKDSVRQMMEFSNMMTYLSSTRSDFFTAYVVIKGYNAGDFSSQGAVESKQMIAVFDRSKISRGQANVRVVGYYELN